MIVVKIFLVNNTMSLKEREERVSEELNEYEQKEHLEFQPPLLCARSHSDPHIDEYTATFRKRRSPAGPLYPD